MIKIENLPIIRITTIAKEEKSNAEKFQSGYKAGHEDGLREGLDLKIHQTRDVTEKEFNEVIRFLAERNLVITYSANYNNGLAVRVDLSKDKKRTRTNPVINITYET